MIPRIIHQLWSTNNIPDSYRYWQRSWREMHPDFEYRLWTNAELEKFVSESFPAYTPLFYSYSENICRVDLARYLILKRYGGLYVDMDFECLRPHHGLLKGHELMMGLEPDSHAQLKKCRAAGLSEIVCNAWIASIPEHPFWAHFLADLNRAAFQDDVLERTGPFVLTRSLKTYKGPPVALVHQKHLYPVDKDACWRGEIQDLEYFEASTKDAFALHHWVGSWFRPQLHLRALPLPRATFSFQWNTKKIDRSPKANTQSEIPMVSCLLIAPYDTGRIRRAIDSFLMQTHPAMELIIATKLLPGRVAMLRKEYPQEKIKWLFADTGPSDSGRDVVSDAINASSGDFIAWWDECVLHDPSQIQHQMGLINETGSNAAFISRVVFWQPKKRRLFISGKGVWKRTLICKRGIAVRFPNLFLFNVSSSDYEAAVSVLDAVHLDAPRLCIYLIDGRSDEEKPYVEELYRGASADFSGSNYYKIHRELCRRLDLERYGSSVFEEVKYSSVGVKRRGQDQGADNVLVLTPMKNTRKMLSRYFELLDRLDYPKGRLHLGILEGDSHDGTFESLVAECAHWRSEFASINLSRLDNGFSSNLPRWHPTIQVRRRANIAIVRNALLNRCLEGWHDWVLWLDADVVDYRPDLLNRLIAFKKDIIVANCIRHDGSVFDKNTFMFFPNKSTSEQSKYLIDGIFQPPSGAGRRYLDTAQEPVVRVDSVGGTALLVRAELHRRGLNFPPFSYRGYIETEGLAVMASEMGVECWGARDVVTVHSDD